MQRNVSKLNYKGNKNWGSDHDFLFLGGFCSVSNSIQLITENLKKPWDVAVI
jgi:hypothetical protein